MRNIREMLADACIFQRLRDLIRDTIFCMNLNPVLADSNPHSAGPVYPDINVDLTLGACWAPTDCQGNIMTNWSLINWQLSSATMSERGEVRVSGTSSSALDHYDLKFNWPQILSKMPLPRSFWRCTFPRPKNTINRSLRAGKATWGACWYLYGFPRYSR